ncbi:hypothetical protein HPP92_004664 [Vanilla planifolia]|uniref:Uncharacterized protein n=1 Tax=Vanilla planifolia TaxID=51239 RepID=A0A835RJX1_VANPL|nr:hypothetical protein HPP92_004664 [Vanilla planifolia]
MLAHGPGERLAIFKDAAEAAGVDFGGAVQVAATKVLSRICAIASGLRPYSLENIVLPDPLQVHDLAFNICRILDEDLCKRDLLISVFDLLVSAAYFQPSILLPILSARVEAGSSVPAGNESKLTKSPIVYTSKCVVGSSIDLMLKYVRRSEVLISSDPHLLLSILNFFKALWDGGIQYNDALKMIRKSATFWEQLSAILAGEHIFDDSVKDCGSDDIHCPSYRVKCQGIVLEIIAREIFILEGFSQTEICEKHTSTNSSKGLGKNGLSIKASLYPSMFQQIDIISSWYEGSQFDVLMKSYASIAFDMEIIFNTKIASCVLIVHLMAILLDGSVECLSMSLVEKISSFYSKMIENPNFSALVQQYSLRGYSEGKEVTRLVLNDLYYHFRVIKTPFTYNCIPWQTTLNAFQAISFVVHLFPTIWQSLEKAFFNLVIVVWSSSKKVRGEILKRIQGRSLKNLLYL